MNNTAHNPSGSIVTPKNTTNQPTDAPSTTFRQRVEGAASEWDGCDPVDDSPGVDATSVSSVGSGSGCTDSFESACSTGSMKSRYSATRSSESYSSIDSTRPSPSMSFTFRSSAISLACRE